MIKCLLPVWSKEEIKIIKLMTLDLAPPHSQIDRREFDISSSGCSPGSVILFEKAKISGTCVKLLRQEQYQI